MNKEKQIIQSLLDSAGITIDGDKPYDIQVHNKNLYSRILKEGSLGLGESYMDGWWDCEQLDQFFYKLFSSKLDKKVKSNLGIMLRLSWNSLISMGMKSKAFEIGKHHYDIGNDLYSAMLDKRLTYTCGYWKNAKSLNEAQEAKLDLVCRKIGIQPKQRILDIGSGWGAFIGYAAKKYNADTVGITVSKKQKELADKLYGKSSVETQLIDYRDLSGEFDHVVSLGMFEHVGYKHYRTFMKVVHSVLKDEGLFLLHTIGGNKSVKGTDPWIAKYIFPNSMIPSAQQITKAIEGLFVIEDWHNFGADYDRTLMEWHKNFEKHWAKLKSEYNERFHRMWRYYLLSSAASFRARKNNLWQIVLSKNGVPGGYKSIR